MGDRDSNEAEVIAILEAVRVFSQSFLKRLIVERSPPMLFLGFVVISASLESFISISVRSYPIPLFKLSPTMCVVIKWSDKFSGKAKVW